MRGLGRRSVGPREVEAGKSSSLGAVRLQDFSAERQEKASPDHLEHSRERLPANFPVKNSSRNKNHETYRHCIKLVSSLWCSWCGADHSVTR